MQITIRTFIIITISILVTHKNFCSERGWLPNKGLDLADFDHYEHAKKEYPASVLMVTDEIKTVGLENFKKEIADNQALLESRQDGDIGGYIYDPIIRTFFVHATTQADHQISMTQLKQNLIALIKQKEEKKKNKNKDYTAIKRTSDRIEIRFNNSSNLDDFTTYKYKKNTAGFEEIIIKTKLQNVQWILDLITHIENKSKQ